MARKKAARPWRKPGTGTVRFKKGRAKPWEAYFTVEGIAPRYDSFRSYEDAAAWLDKFAEEKREGTRDLVGGAMLVQHYLPMWLELRAGHVAPKTMSAYTYYCEYACGEGALGRLRVDEVTHLIGQRMINRLAGDGYKNVAQLKAVLYQAFEYAFDPLEYIRKNPFAKVKAPPVERREGIALTKDERARLLDMAAKDDAVAFRDGVIPPPLCPFWHLTSRLAFRRGEAASLKWSHVDLDKATVTIATTRGRLGREHIEGKTKNKKVRAAPLPLDMVELFRAFKVKQMESALLHGWKWSEQGYVFVDDMTGTPLSIDRITYRWERIRKAAKLPSGMTIHHQRHTALTILELDGTPDSVLMALAGHSTAAMTRHYTDHASIDDVRRAVG